MVDFVGHSVGALVCFFVDCRHNKRIMLLTQIRYANKFIVTITKAYIERNTLQLEHVAFIHV